MLLAGLIAGARCALGGEADAVVLKFLGNAGWEIKAGGKTILIDPFLTRTAARNNSAWSSDERAVLKTIAGADYIFAGHSHADHIGDVPFIAKRFGSRVIGSRTTINLALSAGVDGSQLLMTKGGDQMDFGGFSVQVIESRHAVLPRHAGRVEEQELLAPRNGPLYGRDFLEGGCLLYYFTFGKHRILHQSSANVLMQKLDGLRPDVVLLAVGRSYDLAEALQRLQPKIVILHHFDEWREPFSGGMTQAKLRRARRFAQEVTAADARIKVVVPEFFMTYRLE